MPCECPDFHLHVDFLLKLSDPHSFCNHRALTHRISELGGIYLIPSRNSADLLGALPCWEAGCSFPTSGGALEPSSRLRQADVSNLWLAVQAALFSLKLLQDLLSLWFFFPQVLYISMTALFFFFFNREICTATHGKGTHLFKGCVAGTAGSCVLDSAPFVCPWAKYCWQDGGFLHRSERVIGFRVKSSV